MPVPSSIDQLSQTPGSNSPAGSESPALLDDYHRTTFAFIAKLRDGQGLSNPVDVASAATTDIGAQTSPIVRITGTTTITSLGTNYAGPRFLTFAGALTLTHNATSLILPGGANITTAAGDCLIAVPNSSSPNGWRVVSYQLAIGGVVGVVPIANGGTGQTTASAAFNALKQAASETDTGVVELATTSEAQAGSSTSLVLTPAGMKAAQIQSGTAVTLTNQTSVDFTGIPSWAERITVMVSSLSTNGTAGILVQLGDSGGFETTGYLASGFIIGGSPALSSSGFPLITSSVATNILNGAMTISKVDGTRWVATSTVGASNAAGMAIGAGSKALSDVLTQVRLTTGNGTDQFDAGVVNVLWE